MRAGDEAGALLDALCARGQITVHGSEIERRDALAEQVAAARLAGLSGAVVVDTREHAATLNVAIRDRLVAAGAVRDNAPSRPGRAVVRRRRCDHDARNRREPRHREPWYMGLVTACTVTANHDRRRRAWQPRADRRLRRKHVELVRRRPATAPKAPVIRVGVHRYPRLVCGLWISADEFARGVADLARAAAGY